VLDPSHPRGRDKARIFRSVLGYERAYSADLIEEIRHAILTHEAVFVRQNRYGRHYRADLTVKGPRGATRIRIGWLFDRGSDVPRLTTAFVLRSTGRRGAESFALFDVVRVRQALPEHNLVGGAEGTIVEILDRPVPAYLVDFSGGSADPADPALPVVALTADQLNLAWPHRPT
jgi:hypothetical protein